MSLFLNISSLNNLYQDCCTLDVSETIERDCLSVLHKLHDQVNGLQLVQVVVQPLARLFNPASLAALVANTFQIQQNVNNLTSVPSPSYSNLTTPTSQNLPSVGKHNHDLDGVSPTIGTTITTTTTTTSSSSTASTATESSSHSRAQSFASAFGGNSSSNTNIGTANNSLISSTSTYMMSPDTAQALIARLDTDRDVNWLMEIIGYGLSMPFSLTGEQDSVKDCCTIYCEWLVAALLPYNEHNEDRKYQQLSKLVPVPIRQEPNRYARKMLSHLYNVFLPRQTHVLSNNSSQKDQSDATLTAVSRQAVLCHRVLRTIESIAQNQANLMDNQTWDHLLALLLTVNDKLLSAPTEPDDIGTQLHDRILGVLFELILLASAKSIPSASLWKTFHEMSLHWRHRPALVDHWRRITLLLTKRLVAMPTILNRNRQENDKSVRDIDSSNMSSTSSAIETAIASMNYENLTQTWYKYLNLLCNPVELSDPSIISRTDVFYHSVCASDSVLDPRQHPCLSVLPQIFMNSMAGLKEFIETFLGTHQPPNEDRLSDQPTPDRHSLNLSARSSIISLSNITTGSSTTLTSNPQKYPAPTTPTPARKSVVKAIGGKVFTSSSGSQANALGHTTDFAQSYEHAKSASIASRQPSQQFMQHRPSLTSLTSRLSHNLQLPQFKWSADRPKCNSILHIFGDWLFSAALIGSDLTQPIADANDGTASESTLSIGSLNATETTGPSSSPLSDRRRLSSKKSLTPSSLGSIRQSSSKQPDSLPSNIIPEKVTIDSPLSADSFECGQAEAMATLCKIFSSKRSTEDISPSYLSRFYLCLQHCLSFGTGQDQRNVKAVSTGGTIKRQLLASVLINSTTLLQKDLDGINLLIPSFIKAIEFVFECGEKEVPIQPPPRQHNRSGSIRNGGYSTLNNVTNYDLRRACILTLLNLLAYPFHFQDLAIRHCLNDSSPTTTFRSLRPRLLKLLFVALQTETDATNMQILFGGLSLTIHDLALSAGKLSSSNDDTRSRLKVESISSANTENDSANSSLDTNNRQDNPTNENSFVYNSNSGFLIKSLHVTCHLLISIWKHDTQVSLAALELLTTIARISTTSCLFDSKDQAHLKAKTRLNNNNDQIEMRNEYKQTTKWICDYICNQCSRPPPAHSRDMHSTIVTAYQCLSVWFYNHPYLLNDENCVHTLMEVIELGVSGQKSRTVNINSATGQETLSVVSKGEKIMKPSSMRVREAAESLLNICMVRSRTQKDSHQKIMSTYDTILGENDIAETFGGVQYRTSVRQIQDPELRHAEACKLFKYFSDEDSVIFGLLEGNHDTSTKDSVICLLRTPFGKHCWKIRFNYCTEKSKDKIIANRTLGLAKLPFQQCTTPSSDARIFPYPAGQNKSLYFNSSAKFFPETLENLPPNDLDRLVATLEDYVAESHVKSSQLKNDLDKIGKIFAHQVLAEQKVVRECSIRIKQVDCEELQTVGDLEAARIIVAHLGLKSSLSSMPIGDKVFHPFAASLESLDHLPMRICDSVSIFYVRKNRTNPKEILESVRERRNVSLGFFEWILELGQPTLVKNHNRWTGKASNSWAHKSSRTSCNQSDTSDSLTTRNQMLRMDHGGAIFDGDRMTIYWSDMCQELAFLVPHKIERARHSSQSKAQTSGSECDINNTTSMSEAPVQTKQVQECFSSHPSSHHDHSSDGLSVCSATSDTSSHSARAPSQQSSPRDPSFASKDQKDSASISRHNVVQKRKSIFHTASPAVGCDTNMMICWLECPDDLPDVPCESLLAISESGYLVDEEHNQSTDIPVSQKSRSRDYVKYFISPMKNGLYRINLMTSFGKHWLALPLVDGMTVSKRTLSSLVRESVLNVCRRRRLDADSYQPPHVKRRLKIQDICNSYKISNRYESTEFYHDLFKSKAN